MDSLKLPFYKKKKSNKKMSIDEPIDPEYEMAKVSKVGMLAPFATEGVVFLKSDSGKEFPITSFSAEVAQCITNFMEQKRDALPSIYNLVEQICEESELFLVKVKVYDSGAALRANLYFTGKKNVILRGFRASDAIALAAFYNIPILIRKKSIEEKTPLK